MPTSSSHRIWRLLIAAALLVCVGLAVLAPLKVQAQTGNTSSDQAAPEAEETGGPQPLPASQITLKEEETANVLKSLRDRPDPLEEIEEIRTKIPEALGQYQDLLEITENSLATSASPRRAEDLKRRWTRAEERVERWWSMVNKRAQSLDRDLETLQDLRIIWEVTEAAAESAEFQEAQISIIRTSVQSVRKEEERFGQRRSELVSLQDQLRSATELIDAGHTQLDTYREEHTARLIEAEAEPFWTMLANMPPPIDHVEHTRHVWNESVEDFREFVYQYRRQLIRHGLLFTALFLMLLVGRYHYRHRESSDSPTSALQRVIDRPLSAALTISLTLILIVFEDAPRIADDFILLAILVPLFRILPPAFPSSLRIQTAILAGLVIVARFEELLTFASPLQRLLLLLITAVAMWAAFRARRIAHDPERQDIILENRYVRLLLLVALILLATALAGNLLGYITLASALTNTVILATFAAVILFAIYHILCGIVWLALSSPWARQLRLIERNDKLIYRRLSTLVGWGIGVYWLVMALNMLQLSSVIWGGLWSFLTWKLGFGDVGVSLWDVISFFIIVWAAFTLSRFIRFILEEDVYWRFRVARGVPNAISTGLHYLILTFGFILAMAAAGIDLTKFSLLAGAFGVGLGFGMQNIVNNFLSGIILIAERPIMPGDTVQIGELYGEVKRIGMRSSTVRTWQGAEVIVPNGNLISQEVINWTLSDRQRRVEVPVGVAYGSDTGQVMYVLKAVATEHKDVLDTPPPMVLFLEFGDSSLNFELRAWCGQEHFLRVRSELTFAVEQALREGGITIPFPQRDLHIKTMPGDQKKDVPTHRTPPPRQPDSPDMDVGGDE